MDVKAISMSDLFKQSEDVYTDVIISARRARQIIDSRKLDLEALENIEDTESQLDKVNQLKVRNYTRIGDATAHPHIGLIAQEVEDIYPHLVKVADDEEEHLLLYKIGMIPILLKAVQELSAKEEALENAK